MGKFFVPTSGPEDWRKFLAQPDRHWRTGYSAKTLAYCWEEADGFPDSVKQVFLQCGINYPLLNKIEFLLGFPEYQVPLPGGRRASQSDIFVLARSQGRLITVAVEGKVAESFGPTVSEWQEEDSDGKRVRLKFLCELLGLAENTLGDIRYQLLHRTASALILAERFNASCAVMLVHSFGQLNDSFNDYQEFVSLFGAVGAPDSVAALGERAGISLYTGWVTGEERYLLV
jgi:hypothetical protein